MAERDRYGDLSVEEVFAGNDEVLTFVNTAEQLLRGIRAQQVDPKVLLTWLDDNPDHKTLLTQKRPEFGDKSALAALRAKIEQEETKRVNQPRPHHPKPRRP